MIVSVIICTHNPRVDYLTRTLSALQKQLFTTDKWELLLVDNASKTLVSDFIDLSWHPFARHVREEKLGLTAARIRGIREAKAELIVFVDDDNCLKEDYLDILVNTMKNMSLLGVLGAGRIIPEFETEPTITEIPFLKSLAIRNEKRPHFSNDVKYHKAIPFGAGICIRRSIALSYVETCTMRALAVSLDRRGNALMSGGDIDLALHACRDGYLAGVLPSLELVHIIPETRLNHNYLVEIAAGHAASSYILSQLWKFEEYPANPFIKWGRYWKKRIQASGLARKILIAEYKAEKEAYLQWKQLILK